MIMATASSSCIYDYLPPCDDSTRLTIVNDWALAPDASPEGMAYLFFPEGSDTPWRFDFPGREAGEVTLPVGTFRFVMFNDDTSAIRFTMDNGALVAYCREGNILEGLGSAIGKESVPYTAEPVEICPDMMWAEGDPLVSVSADKITYEHYNRKQRITDYDKVLHTYPSQLIARYSYEITDVANLDGVRQMCAAMSGLAASLHIGDREHSPSAVTLPFRASATGTGKIGGEFLTFGLPQPHHPEISPNILHLFVWLTDGRRFEYLFNVTEQVSDAPDPLDVKITVKGLQLPEAEPGHTPGAFDPTVDGWTKVTINIEA